MIMHNVSPTLFNGTRVTYHRRVGKCLEVEVVNGVHKGELHYLPRLVLTARSVAKRANQVPTDPATHTFRENGM